MRNFFEIQALLKKEELTFLQYCVLQACYDEPRSMSEMAQIAGHSTAACTGMMDRLTFCELVTRKHDIKDRRKIFVCITQKGRDLVEMIKSDGSRLHGAAD